MLICTWHRHYYLVGVDDVDVDENDDDCVIINWQEGQYD